MIELMKMNTYFADLILLFVALIWGTTFVLVENAIEFLPPFSFNAIRFFLAGSALFVLVFVLYPTSFKKIDRRLILSGFILGIWLFSGYLFQTVGLVYTTSSKAGFITGLSVVLVPILAFFILKQRIKQSAILGIGLATIGLYCLTLGDLGAINIGDVLVLACAVSFALQIVLTGKYVSYYPTLVLAMVQILTVSVLSGIGATLLGEWEPLIEKPSILIEPTILLALGVCSLFATAFAYVAQTELQRFTTATRVALIFAMEPVFAALTDVWWNNTLLSKMEWTGCLLILLGMIFAEIKWRKSKKTGIQ